MLVERVEDFATELEWQRAYFEINAFEEQLVETGTVVLKFWLHIDADEQLRRFREREKLPTKQHKITDEDWRNRDRGEVELITETEPVSKFPGQASSHDQPQPHQGNSVF